MRIPYELLTGLRYPRAKRRNISSRSFPPPRLICIGAGRGHADRGAVGDEWLRARCARPHPRHGSPRHHLSPGEGRQLARAGRGGGARIPRSRPPPPYIRGRATCCARAATSPAPCWRGIDPRQEQKVSEMRQHNEVRKLEDLKPGEFDIVLGVELRSSWAGRRRQDRPDDPAGQRHPGRHSAALPPLQRGRRVPGRQVRVRPRPEWRLNIRTRRAVSRWRPRHRRAPEAGDDLFDGALVARQVAQRCRSWSTSVDWTRQPRHFFRAVATEKDRDVPDPVPAGRHRRLQHRLHPGDGGAGEQATSPSCARSRHAGAR